LTNPMDLNTPSDVPNMSTTSDARLSDRGLRLLTLVERLCKGQRQPHLASAIRKSIPSTSNAGPYLIRTLMHSSTCARDANLVHYHLSMSALRDTARCFGASQRNGQDLEPVSRSRWRLHHCSTPMSRKARSACGNGQPWSVPKKAAVKDSMRDLCSAEPLATRLHIMIAV